MRLRSVVRVVPPAGGLPAVFLFSSLTFFVLASGDGSADSVLARWRGGELTRETLTAGHPQAEEALVQGGGLLRDTLLKAVYIEIYHNLALKMGLDRDPEIVADLNRRRERKLAALYRAKYQPDLALEISEEDLRAYYQLQLAEFTTPGEVDFEALFVRCGERLLERDPCRHRMASLKSRVESGSEFNEVIAEERARSGPANGSFSKVAPNQLAAELRQGLEATPEGAFSPVIETRIGLFWTRVLRRATSVQVPFESAERRIRRLLAAEKVEKWEEEERDRLKQRLGNRSDNESLEHLFAAAARAEGLDREPGEVAKEGLARRWRLANEAFYRDPGSLPSDEELARHLEQPRTAGRYQQYRVLLAVIRDKDRSAAIARASEVRAEMKSSTEPGSVLRRLAENDLEISVDELGPLTFGALRRRHRAVSEIVEKLEPGNWKGPFAFAGPVDNDPVTRPAFVVFESVAAATVEQARQGLYKEFRSRLSGDVNLYGKTLGSRWDLEFVVEVEGLPKRTGSFVSIPSLLESLAEGADPAENVTLNDRRVVHYASQIQAEKDERKRFELEFLLTRELLLAGETKRSIERLQQLEKILNESGAKRTAERFRQLREWLGLAYLRLGEQDNCVAHHSADSCLVPIGKSGVHANPRGSRGAVHHYTALLEDFPEDLSYRWLLNLAYMTLGKYPDHVPKDWLVPPSVFSSGAEHPRFAEVASDRGLSGVGLSGGVVMEDFDGDGWLDLMSSSWGLKDPLRTFRNQGPDDDGLIRFEDRTVEAGIQGETGGLNLVHADYDNDGDADVLVLRGAWLFQQGLHPNSLLRNHGDGRFENVTREAGIYSLHPTQTAAWADYDNDGWLDLFIGNESSAGNPHPCELFRNNRDGSFTDVAAAAGLAVTGFVKGVAWGDVDNDGWVDLYVSRFGELNQLFRNLGDGRFEEIAAAAGVSEPRMSFSTWFWDVDNDGWTDLLVAPYAGFLSDSLPLIVGDYLGQQPPLDRLHVYRNHGNGGDGGPTFTNVAGAMEIDVPLLAMGANFGDLDNDGFLDAYFGTGEPNLATLVPNRMFLNQGGRQFADVTSAGGFGHLQKGHGIAFGDVDNDGDQDIYAVMGGAYSGDVFADALFENPGSENHWLTLRLVGESSNRSAIGARIQVRLETDEGGRDVHVTVGTGGSFGASSLQQEIGLGRATAIEWVSVKWPGETFPRHYADLPLDRIVVLRQTESRPLVVP